MIAATSVTLHEQISALTGIPVDELWDTGSLLRRLPQIELDLKARIVGQQSAVETILTALRARLLRSTAERPVLCLLAVGPSGVGKTETAVQLARTCLGNPEAIVRLDMSEYYGPHVAARLVGSPPGYVGHDSGGELTEAVRRRPRSGVLFDEIEKAAPEVLDLLLQVMSAGRLTDARGQTIDFRRTIIILTSNLGNSTTGTVPERDGFEQRILDAVRSHLRPELIGRLDGTVVYRHLSLDDIESILRIQLTDLARTMHGVQSFEVSPEAVRRLAQESYSPDGGARKIRKVLEQHLDPAVVQLFELGLLDHRRPVDLRVDFRAGQFLIEKA